jgi:N-acetylated-alpha-linked acidic dipeptidase
VALAAALTAHEAAAQGGVPETIPGFSATGAQQHQRWEEIFLSTPRADSARRHLRILTEEPHVAGTPGDHAVALYIRDRMRAYGLDAELVEYEVLLNYPRRVELELTAPRSQKLSLREVPIPGDKDSADSSFFDGFHGYSADGEVHAQVVYVNYGRPEDYGAIEKLGVSVAGKIVMARYGKLFRGLKVRIAQEHGAAGVILYSDPADDGYTQGDIYPKGPWRHPSAIQRGSVMFLSKTPGDPSTPGWGSTKGAKRVSREDAESLPRIPSLPISYGEAAKILTSLDGPNVPKGFQGGLPFAYHVGPGQAAVRMRVENDYGMHTIWNVVATIPGSEWPDRWVVCGNHHDAWTYGAADPNGGTAASLEMARAFGAALQAGWRPRRTIVLCNWDGEEYGLLGSVEWGESQKDELPGKVVTYFNMDSAVRGDDLRLQGVPSLRDHMVAVIRDIPDPVTGLPLYDAWSEKVLKDGKKKWLERMRVQRAAGLEIPPREPELGSLGSGSDYTVFLDHLGIPSIDLRFSGPDGIYHSAYDNLTWMERFGDPLFVYHATAAKLWGLAAMRMADAELLPLRYSRYAVAIEGFLDDIEAQLEDDNLERNPAEQLTMDVSLCRELVDRMQGAALELEAPGGPGLSGESLASFNDQLVAVELDFIALDGIKGRPWFRHLVYAPGKDTGYAPIPLPEPAHAIKDRNQSDLDEGMRRLEEVLTRATERLETLAGTD